MPRTNLGFLRNFWENVAITRTIDVRRTNGGGQEPILTIRSQYELLSGSLCLGIVICKRNAMVSAVGLVVRGRGGADGVPEKNQLGFPYLSSLPFITSPPSKATLELLV
jgi:hypothetical protein